MNISLSKLLRIWSTIFSIILLSCNKDDLPALPTLETSEIKNITATTASGGGRIISDGGIMVTEKGVCWSLKENPSTSDSRTVDGESIGQFTSALTGLIPGSSYYVKAYATNRHGTYYGNEVTFKTISQSSNGQIIADHTVVDKFDDIPQYYIDLVKKMWVTYPGESHSEDIRSGMIAFAAAYPKFVINSPLSGPPEAYTSVHLRYSRATWGDINNPSGWIYDYGEEDWFDYVDNQDIYHYAPDAVARTKAGLAFCNSNGLILNATGFGWCWDYNDGINADFYLAATQAYIDYCIENEYATKVFFTTGPTGNGGILPPSMNYILYLRSQQIRNYVLEDPTRILFDFADILAYNDAGELTAESDGIHTYPSYNTDNDSGSGLIHMGTVGGVRLAKAMWWMLARISGWDGN